MLLTRWLETRASSAHPPCELCSSPSPLTSSVDPGRSGSPFGMASEDHVRLQGVEVEASCNVAWLLRLASEYVLELGCSGEVSGGLEHAASLIERAADASMCVEAMHITARVLPVCFQRIDAELEYIPVKNLIVVVEKRLREILVLRVQSTLPFDDPDAFEEAVNNSFGCRIARGNHQLYSTVMQAYRKVIWEKGYVNAFPSKSEQEKEKSLRKRPKRDKK